MAFVYNELNNDFNGEVWNTPKSRLGTLTPVSGPITVTPDGVVQSTGGDGFVLLGGAYTLTVNGQVASLGAFNGLFIDDAYASGFAPGVTKVTVGETGIISGSFAGGAGSGIVSSKSLSVTNAGTISGDREGIYFNGDVTETLTVVNTGTIWTPDATTRNAIFAMGGGARTITNSGDIFGALNIFGGTQKITNTTAGWIGGNVDLANGVDTVTNAGVIEGYIATYDGSDTVTNSGTVGGYVNLGNQNNKFTNSGTIAGANISGEAVTFSNDNDTMTNSGQLVIGGVYLGAGTNSLTNSASGTIGGNVVAFGGADKITNSGKINGNVDLGGDVNSLTNSASGIISGSIFAGAGADKVTNSGKITGNVELGDGVNSLTNSGTITGNVTRGTGVNTITNSGTIEGAIQTGESNDVVKNTGRIVNITDLEDGDDSYTGGNFVDQVYDYNGKDTYALGGGDDFFSATAQNNININDGVGDKVDGGTNTAVNFKLDLNGDIYSAGASTSSVFVNADSIAHTNAEDSYIAVSQAAGTASGLSIGLDFISNFESFSGGSNNDLIWGNASANGIIGNGGFDHLHGGAGKDWISGGDGDDEISGDAGADVLNGGVGFDSFKYHKLTDSTVGKAGRDVITDFTANEDVLDFRKINTPLINLHLNAAEFTDAAFDGTNGAVRLLTITEGWLVQIDTNGDRKVDMSIQVNDAAHSIAWDSSEFLFT